MKQHDPEAEKNILSCALKHSRDTGWLYDEIKPGDIEVSSHRIAWAALGQLRNEGIPINFASLAARLKDNDWFENAGGQYFINSIFGVSAQLESLRYCVDTVKECARNKSISRHILNMQEHGDTWDADLDALRGLLAPVPAAKTDTKRSVAEILISYRAELEWRHQNPGAIPGIPTGFRDIDEVLLGFHPKTLTVIGGRPGMGKTTLALQFVLNQLLQYKQRVTFITLEMSEEELVGKMMSNLCLIDGRRMLTGELQRSEWSLYDEKSALLSDAALSIHKDAFSPSQIRGVVESEGADIVFIDHGALLRSDGEWGTRREEQTEISFALKQLAKDLDIPVVALMQLSRNKEGTKDKRPTLGDLRESGSWEQDADNVMFIYRDAYYNDTTEKPFETEIIVAKNRKGQLGKPLLTSCLEYSMFQPIKQPHIPLRYMGRREPPQQVQEKTNESNRSESNNNRESSQPTRSFAPPSVGDQRGGEGIADSGMGTRREDPRVPDQQEFVYPPSYESAAWDGSSS